MLSFEITPPRILRNEVFEFKDYKLRLQTFLGKIESLRGRVPLVHFTDSPLGVPSMSGFIASSTLKKVYGNSMQIRNTVRIADHSLNGILQIVADANLTGFEGILFVRGDKAKIGLPANKLKSSEVVSTLRRLGFKSGTRFYLPANIDEKKENLSRKLVTEPEGIIVQPASTVDQLCRIKDMIGGDTIRLVATLLVPSQKNRAAAKLLGVNWSAYCEDCSGFVRSLAKEADEVEIISPNDFASGLELLDEVGD